jgi:DNA-binding CsgD family transcriptional regulator
MVTPDEREGVPGQGPAHVLVGRTEVQATLRRNLAVALGGDGQVCLLGGEAGIGKTALARDLSHVAGQQGARVLTGSCYDLGNTPPYGLWLDLFDACQRDPTLPDAPPAFAGGRLAPVTDQAALHADVRRFMALLTEHRTALVTVEDLHWADPASLDLLRHIGPYIRHWPIMLLVTYREDELSPGSPFARHLPALVREAGGQRIGLSRLDSEALRAWVSAQYRLVAQDEDRLIAYLEQHADGNPFFVTEILRTLEVDGLLQMEAANESSFGSLDRVVVPPLLRQVIDGRVMRLAPTARHALAIASVIGQEVPLDLWAAVAGIDDDALVDVVEEATRARLLEAEPDGKRVRFIHALTREAILEGILAPRRRIWHGRIAEMLLLTPRPDPDAVAYHLQQAGDPRAATWLIAAGERAQLAYAWLTADKRFQAAADLLDGVEGQELVRCRLLARIFFLLRFAYPASAVEGMEEALRLAEDSGDAFTFAETVQVLGTVLVYTDQSRVGLAKMDEGLTAIEHLPPIVQRTVNTMQEWLSHGFTGHHDQPAAGDAAVLERLQAAGVDFRRSYYCWFMASAGRLAEAATIEERLAGLLAGRPEPGRGIRLAASFVLHARAVIDAARGKPGDAREHWNLARPGFGDHHVLVAFTLLDELRDVALTYGLADPAHRRWCASQAEAALERAIGVLQPGTTPRLGWLRCLTIDGRWDEAVQILEELPPPGNNFLRRESTFTRATIARHRGQPDLAWEAILPLLPQGPDTEPGDLIHQEGLSLLRIAASLSLDAGDVGEARRWLAAHDRWLAWSGSMLGEAEGQLAWGQVYHAAGDDARARSYLAEALARSEQPAQPWVRIGAHLVLGELDTNQRQFAGARDHLSTAAALAETCDLPYEQGLIRLALAGLHAAAGDAEGAMAIASDAASVFRALGAAPSLARADALCQRISGFAGAASNRFGLTPRELEVLHLLAEGRTNPEIAAALFISRRTAATHVSNIYRKLDVTTRARAVDRAHRHNMLTP